MLQQRDQEQRRPALVHPYWHLRGPPARSAPLALCRWGGIFGTLDFCAGEGPICCNLSSSRALPATASGHACFCAPLGRVVKWSAARYSFIRLCVAVDRRPHLLPSSLFLFFSSFLFQQSRVLRFRFLVFALVLQSYYSAWRSQHCDVPRLGRVCVNRSSSSWAEVSHFS